MTTISVALCTCNGAAYVEEQLESISAQSRPPDELVIFDDQSTDRTPSIVDAFSRSVSFPVRFAVNEKRLGSTGNFEQAVRACRYEIVVLSDQDDIWYPHKLQRIEDVFKEAGGAVGALFSDADLIDRDGRPLKARMWEHFSFGRRLQERVVQGEAFDVLLRKHVVPGCTMAFRRDLSSLILPFPDVGIHDRWIAILIAAVGKVDVIRESLMQYRQHQGQQLGVALSSLGVAVRDGGFSVQVARARRPAANVYGDLAELYDAVMTRLATVAAFRSDDAVIRKLRAKITHLQVRGALPGSLLQRFPVVLGEMARLRYHRYSNGMYSMARDIFFGS